MKKLVKQQQRVFSLCRVKFDSTKKQLMAEVIGSKKRKEVMIVFTGSLLDPIYLEIAGSGGRFFPVKDWEDKDFYGNDDDRFFDLTDLVKKKPLKQMKKAEKLTRSQRPFNHWLHN